jgi:hypothetical protein
MLRDYIDNEVARLSEKTDDLSIGEVNALLSLRSRFLDCGEHPAPASARNLAVLSEDELHRHKSYAENVKNNAGPWGINYDEPTLKLADTVIFLTS